MLVYCTFSLEMNTSLSFLSLSFIFSHDARLQPLINGSQVEIISSSYKYITLSFSTIKQCSRKCVKCILKWFQKYLIFYQIPNWILIFFKFFFQFSDFLLFNISFAVLTKFLIFNFRCQRDLLLDGVSFLYFLWSIFMSKKPSWKSQRNRISFSFVLFVII